ncbi:MAG: hypothetical protein RLY58_1275 [Pseudomonadota bacterium]|jgi:phage host-nuclease inhibitor protein Gam
MARKAMAEPQLKSWDAVDLVLAQMADVERSIGLEQAACNEQVDQLKQASKDRIKPLADQMKALELSIKEFCDHHRNEFVQVKTRRLVYGSVGYRLSTTVSIPDAEFTLKQLQLRVLDHCIRTKYEPDKDQIKQLDPDLIAEIGCKLSTKNTFGYDLAKVNPAAAVA